MKFHSVDSKVTGRIVAANLFKIRRSLLVLGALIALVSLGGCAIPAQPKADDADTIVGKPPSAEEDPFFVRGTPANAERVQAQGRIEPVEAPEDVATPEVAPEEVATPEVPPEAVATPEVPPEAAATPEVAPEEVATPEGAPAEDVETPAPLPPPTPAEEAPEEPRIEVAARGELNAVSRPEPAKTEPVIPETPATAQCFSCVKICPLAGDCARADEDIICGWGTQTNISAAKELARAQCDATLDLARQMPVWSRIDGECPAATCR